VHGEKRHSILDLNDLILIWHVFPELQTLSIHKAACTRFEPLIVSQPATDDAESDAVPSHRANFAAVKQKFADCG
jgi:hypothetical protein